METEQNQAEDQLRLIAKKRVKFKHSLKLYVVLSIFFWIIWYFSGGRYDFEKDFQIGKIPWPLWAMAGWGLGLVLQYISAYHTPQDLEEKEYQKLKNRNF